MRTQILAMAIAAIGSLVTFAATPAEVDSPLANGLVRADAAIPTRGEWGQWLRYFRGDTSTTKDMIVLAVTLKPGQEPHPPHRHAEEELMILAEGSGVWSLDGKQSPARKGDFVYAAPWITHGIKNSGDTPLTYYMVKWSGKGASPPDAPPATVQNDKPLQPAQSAAAVVRDRVQGSINHGDGKTWWRRVAGKARAIDARTLQFADGSRIELDITAPDLDQMAMNGDSLYPCGKDATEFLNKLIGDHTVACYQNDKDGPWLGYVGDTSIEYSMIVGGWALTDHSSLHVPEIIAREHKRGLWRGQFVNPDDWRAGKRLAAEREQLPGSNAEKDQ